MKDIIFTILIFLIILPLISCGGKEIHLTCGISEVSQTGINHIQPFIDAMEKYKKDRGNYPAQETDLIPSYISKIPMIVRHDSEEFDKTKYNILQTDKIEESGPFIEKDGSSFFIRLYPKDERICFLGRNNVCEYTSETKRWGCYQH